MISRFKSLTLARATRISLFAQWSSNSTWTERFVANLVKSVMTHCPWLVRFVSIRSLRMHIDRYFCDYIGENDPFSVARYIADSRTSSVQKQFIYLEGCEERMYRISPEIMPFSLTIGLLFLVMFIVLADWMVGPLLSDSIAYLLTNLLEERVKIDSYHWLARLMSRPVSNWWRLSMVLIDIQHRRPSLWSFNHSSRSFPIASVVGRALRQRALKSFWLLS